MGAGMLSLVSEEGYALLKELENPAAAYCKSRGARTRLGIENLVERLNLATAELDQRSQLREGFTEEPSIRQGKVCLGYFPIIDSLFYYGEKELLDDDPYEGISYQVEIDYLARILYLEFKPASVKPRLFLSRSEVKALREQWEMLKRVNQLVDAVLDEYALAQGLIYSGPFRYRQEITPGQGTLPGFLDAGDLAEGNYNGSKATAGTLPAKAIEEFNDNDVPF